jgi:hypothetical protein
MSTFAVVDHEAAPILFGAYSMSAHPFFSMASGLSSRFSVIACMAATLWLSVGMAGAADEPATQPTTKPAAGEVRPARPPMKSAPLPSPIPKPKPRSGTFQTAADAAAHVTAEDPDMQIKAVTWLADHRVDPAQHELVISGLRDRVNTLSDPGRRLTYVRAFARYADASDIPDLMAIIEYPEEVERMSGQEACWAAALAGIVRIGDAEAAHAALKRRLESFFFKGSAKTALQPFVQIDAPQAELASELIDRIEGR